MAHLKLGPLHFHIWVVVILITLSRRTAAIDTSQCIAPLGMEHGLIKDEDITASSSFDSGNVGPQHGRIRTESHGGAWCPKNQITSEPREWLEIDLHTVHVLTATETQGRFGNGQGQEFAEAYVLQYWRPRLGKWVPYRDFKGEEKMKGNTNTYLESKQELDPPIWASKIRFLPYSYHRRTVCMRVEIYGCYYNDGIVSYSMPQGDKRGSGWEFYDATYDGHWAQGGLKRGLGLLTDGRFGPENFKMGYYDHERAQGWVGWRNDTRNGKPVEITFEFDRVREFTAVHVYCNNQFTRDVQVFSDINVTFSIGGTYYTGEPITYSPMEDRIFENSRNETIKLHHRIGRFVKLQMSFAAKWIMISEVMFDSDVAPDNFTEELPPSTEIPAQGDIYVEKSRASAGSEVPISTAQQREAPAYVAVLIGVLTAVALLLSVAVFFIVRRHRRRKCFASPLTSKQQPTLTPAQMQQQQLSTAGTLCLGGGLSNEKNPSYAINDLEDYTSRCNMSTLPVPHLDRDSMRMRDRLVDIKMDDYQEPYQALRYAPYYSYSTVVMEMQDMLPPSNHHSDTSNYDYAVPELGTAPLLPPERGVSGGSSTLSGGNIGSEQNEVGYCRGGPRTNVRGEGKKSPSQQEVLNALKKRLEQTAVPEFPRHRLRMLSKLADGAFGTVYIAEADGIPEYASQTSLGKRLVAVKFLLQDASEKEKADFHRDVRILGALEDPHIARVLGACWDEPLAVVLEYLELGDLRAFLLASTGPGALEGPPAHLASGQVLTPHCLLHMAAQIAAGMRYLESLNFVHRDLATRNCLVGKGYQIKISDFGTDNELYASDYYKVDGSMPLPIRWIAWESVFLGKYTTKSDVWSFAVTLSEILNLARRQPYEGFSDPQVVENLSHMDRDDGQFVFIPRPMNATKDIYDLMLECWRRSDCERPSFREIHLFLQRMLLGFNTPVS